MNGRNEPHHARPEADRDAAIDRACDPRLDEPLDDALDLSAERPLPDAVIDLRTTRLAELVAGLTGCEPGGALHAVRTHEADADAGDVLEVVARAMVDVDQPVPEGFRVAGFLKHDRDGDPPVAPPA